MIDNNQSQSGFALLVAIIVVSVVISIGLSILDLTIKQVRLSSDSTDSEIAFHAANAGLECARYLRRTKRLAIDGDPFPIQPLPPPPTPIGPTPSGLPMIDVSCFGSPSQTVVANSIIDDSDRKVFSYTYEIQWAGEDRCSEVDMLVAVVNFDTTFDSVVANATVRGEIGSYPDGDFVCPPSSVCTVVSVKGYNRSCSAKNSIGTIQRDVLLEF